MDGGWVSDANSWMSRCVNQEFRELDYNRWSQTSYARTRTERPPRRQQVQDPGDDFGRGADQRWGAS